MSSAPIVRTKSIVPLKYCSTLLSFVQSSSVGHDTLVVKKPTAVCMSRRHLLEINNSDAVTLWKLPALSSVSSGDSLILGAIGSGAERDTAEAVEAYIKERIPDQ